MPELLLCCALSVQPLSSFLLASVLPFAASNFTSVDAPTFVRFLTFFFLGFVTFVFFTLCCQLFFILPCHLFFFINPSVLSYYLSFLLPDEACERSVLNSTVCCPSVCCSFVSCSLKYHTLILFVIHKCRNFCSVANFRAANVVFFAGLGAAFCC